jgi:hypothetical protein
MTGRSCNRGIALSREVVHVPMERCDAPHGSLVEAYVRGEKRRRCAHALRTERFKVPSDEAERLFRGISLAPRVLDLRLGPIAHHAHVISVPVCPLACPA